MDNHPRMRFTLVILLALGFAGPLAAQPPQNPQALQNSQPLQDPHPQQNPQSLQNPQALQNPQSLQNPLTYVQAGQWTEAQVAAMRNGDPLAGKLIDYLRMLTPNAARASEIDAFMRQNPDWPLLTLMARRRQEAIAAEPDNAALGGLCLEPEPTPTPAVTHGFSFPPVMPARGAAALRCAEALADLGRAKEAGALAREAWVSADIRSNHRVNIHPPLSRFDVGRGSVGAISAAGLG